MKRNTMLFLWISLLAVLAISGCHNRNPYTDNEAPQDLVIEIMADTTVLEGIFSDSGDKYRYELGAEVDFPVEGPKPLVDSVKLFINSELYQIFDRGADFNIHIPFEKTLTWTGDNIVTDYISHYSPLYVKSDLGAGARYLTMFIATETDTYVTYYVERCYCGAGCSYEYDCYTFRKRDGHLLKEILTEQNLDAFLKAFPEYKEITDQMMYMGLTNEGLECHYLVISDWPDYNPEEGWKETIIPYSEIKPYLSKEAQELIPESE